MSSYSCFALLSLTPSPVVTDVGNKVFSVSDWGKKEEEKVTLSERCSSERWELETAANTNADIILQSQCARLVEGR